MSSDDIPTIPVTPADILNQSSSSTPKSIRNDYSKIVENIILSGSKIPSAISTPLQVSQHSSPQVSTHPSKQVSVQSSPQVSVHPSKQVSQYSSPQVSIHPSKQVSAQPSTQVSVHASKQGSVHPSKQASVRSSKQVSTQVSNKVSECNSPIMIIDEEYYERSQEDIEKIESIKNQIKSSSRSNSFDIVEELDKALETPCEVLIDETKIIEEMKQIKEIQDREMNEIRINMEDINEDIKEGIKDIEKEVKNGVKEVKNNVINKGLNIFKGAIEMMKLPSIEEKKEENEIVSSTGSNGNEDKIDNTPQQIESTRNRKLDRRNLANDILAELPVSIRYNDSIYIDSGETPLNYKGDWEKWTENGLDQLEVLMEEIYEDEVKYKKLSSINSKCSKLIQFGLLVMGSAIVYIQASGSSPDVVNKFTVVSGAATTVSSSLLSFCGFAKKAPHYSIVNSNLRKLRCWIESKLILPLDKRFSPYDIYTIAKKAYDTIIVDAKEGLRDSK